MIAGDPLRFSLPGHNLFARVIIPFNLDRPYSYHIPSDLVDKIKTGDYKALARAISLVENEFVGYEEMLEKLPTLANKAKHIERLY